MTIIEPVQLACLLRLTREEALIFIAFLGGRSSHEIAETTDKTPHQIRTVVARALSRMPKVGRSRQQNSTVKTLQTKGA